MRSAGVSAAVLLLLSAAARAETADQALLASINARDKAASADAATEYRRRLALLPRIAKARSDEGLRPLQALDDELDQELSWIESDEKSLPRLDLKDVKRTVPLLPGPPKTDLEGRVAYWKARQAEFQKLADALGRKIDPDGKNAVVDEFGDSVPESLPRRRDENQKILDESRRETADLAAKIDDAMKPLDRDLRLRMPMLSGLTLAKLLKTLENYRSDVLAIRLPNDGSDAATQASTKFPGIASDASALRRAALRWSRADAAVSAVDRDLNGLTRAQAGLSDLARMAGDVLSDAELDRQFVDGSSGELYVPARERKLALVRRMIPVLKSAKVLVENGLIPYQKRRVDAAAGDGPLARYYEAKLALVSALK